MGKGFGKLEGMKNRSSDCKKIFLIEGGEKGDSLFCGSQREKVASPSLVITTR
jgi:hypothetical protein